MEFGINILSIIPVRSEPDDRAEMVTQILFGETMTKLDSYKSWIQIRSIYDNYEGWTDIKQFYPLDEPEFNRLNNSIHGISSDLVQLVKNIKHDSLFPILLGSTLPDYRDTEFSIGNLKYSYEGEVSECKISKEKICEYAYLYLRTPYLWGGRSPFGIDCSGFTQMVYKLNGVPILRDARLQATQGETINLVSEAEPGDLAFFDNEEGEIIHVGLLLPDDKIIHASGLVRIDEFDHQGIYNKTQKKYTYKLRIIKRIL